MLLVELVDDRFRVLQDLPVTVQAEQVGGERLGAGVDDGAIRRRPADDGRQHGHRTLLRGRRVAAEQRTVVVDVGAGAIFRHRRKALVLPHVGAAARRHDRDVQSRRTAGGDRCLEGLLALQPLARRRIGHQPAEAQCTLSGNVFRQFGDGRRVGEAAAPAAGVAFHQHADACAGGLCRVGDRIHDFPAVGDDREVAALRDGAQPGELRGAQRVRRQEKVGDAGIGHHFGFAHGLHRHALGAELDLPQRPCGGAVRLDVRTVGEPGAVATLLPAAEVGVRDPSIDQHRRRFQRFQRTLHREQPRAHGFGQFTHDDISCFIGDR